jgi:hypothetical protein
MLQNLYNVTPDVSRVIQVEIFVYKIFIGDTQLSSIENYGT